MKPLFILGAGFSRWIYKRMPLMGDLANSIPNEIADKIIKTNLISIYSRKDIEYLLSYLHSNYPWKSEEEKYSNLSLYSELIQYIVNTIDKSSRRAIEYINNKYIRRLVSYWQKSPTWILTFNYDLLVEEILSEYYGNIDWYNYWDLPLVDISKRTNIEEGMYLNGGTAENAKRPKILLTKLHGSINWYRSKYNPTPNEPVYYMPRLPFSNHIRTNLKGLQPFIIPPSIDKSSYLNHDILNVIWDTARKQLSGDSQIFILGYSFPVTDVYLNLLFDICMTKEKKVTIINDDDSIDFKNRMHAYFTKYGIEPDLTYIKKESINNFIDNEVK